MIREARQICRLLTRKSKHILPLMIVGTMFVYIIRDEVTISREFFIPTKASYFIHGGNFSTYRPKNITVVSPGRISRAPTPMEKEIFQLKGKRNAAIARDKCRHINTPVRDVRLTVRWSKQKDLLFCPIYKVGTTFWRRVFMVQREPKYNKLVNPYEIPFDKDYPAQKELWKQNTNTSAYKVMFTRDPYNRLFSFYVDKILAPNPYFWKSVGLKVLRLLRFNGKVPPRTACGHDITFSEFIKYVIYTLEKRQEIDPHWIEMDTNCQPCTVKYDFIGKMEDFSNDSLRIVEKLGLSKMASFLNQSGSDASYEDAMKDTLSQPFTFRIKYRMCISFKEAVSRAWHKMQIRGLVGNETLPEPIDERTTKLTALISHARASRRNSTSSERKKIKENVFKQYWSSVDLEDLYKLRTLYSKDFLLFGYEQTPDVLFKRDKPV